MDQITAPIKSDKALQVPCPTCSSAIGEPCIGIRGRPRSSFHSSRLDDVPATPKRRASISPRVRFDIFKRDDFTCQYCGATPPQAVLHLEHITAIANGGDNSETNLTTACSICNGGKGAVPLDKVPASLSVKSAQIAEAEAQLAGYAEIMAKRRDRIESETWRVIETLYLKRQTSHARFNTVSMFVRTIGVESVVDAAEIALSRHLNDNDEFRYFCGICWKRIKGNQK